MGLFIRKSFRVGPIRFNLSKSGIGVSAGVTGARIGVGPRGAYVAGGRGGLYFRESIGRSSTGRRRSSSAGGGRSGASIEEVFVDTGAAFPVQVRRSEMPPSNLPAIPAPKSTVTYFVIGTLCLLFAVPTQEGLLVLLLLVGLAALGKGISLSVGNVRLKKGVSAADAAMERMVREFHDGKAPRLDVVPEEVKRAPWQIQKDFAFRAGQVFLAAFLGDRVDRSSLHACVARLGLDGAEFAVLKYQVFIGCFNQFVEDLVLGEGEEAALKMFAEKLEIPEQKIGSELETIRYLSSIREQSNSPLVAIHPGIPLDKSEECYFSSAVRVLKEKVLRTRTQNGVKIKTRGHELESEGIVYLTSKRILIVAGGTKSYPVGKVLDHTLDMENNVLEITVDGRKTPVLLSMPSIAPFAAKLEKIQQLNG